MKYYIEVNVLIPKKCGCPGGKWEWQKLRSSHDSAPYVYNSRREAMDILKVCYGDELRFNGYGQNVRITSDEEE